MGWRNKLRKLLIIYSESDESNLRMKEKMKKKTVNIRPQNNFLFFLFARSWMRKNSHVLFCNRDEIKKKPSTITQKKLDFVNNIEEE